MDLPERNEWYIIGISGVTCGGKTSLTNSLKKILCPIYVFHQDKYFYPDDHPGHIRCEGLEHNNYDILNALNMEQMYADIVSTIQGTDKSQYKNDVASKGKLKVNTKKIMILEGFTTLNYAPIMEICDLKYYLILTREQCLERRVYRVYDPPDIDGYFDHCVWPEHLRYRAEIEKNLSVFIIDGSQPGALELVIADLKKNGATEVDS